MSLRNRLCVLSTLVSAACSGNEATRPGAGTGGVSSTSSGGTTTSGGSAGTPESGGSAGTATQSGGSAGTALGGSAGTAQAGGRAGAVQSGGSAGIASSAGAGNAGASGANGAAGALGTAKEETLPPLPSVRQEHAVVALDGEIYAVGGFTPNATATVEAYDPEARTWRKIADFPRVLQHANAAVVAGKLYVTGFFIGSSFSNTSGQVFEYDPAEDQWTEKAAMPIRTERASACVAALGNKIYVFGGARGPTVADASAYDVVLDEWEALPALSQTREHCVAGAIDGIIYIAAGRSGSITGLRPSTLAYDPALQTYTEKAPLRTPRGGVAGAVLGQRLFVFGGEGNSASESGVFPEIEAYDPITDSWSALPPMQVPRHGFGAAALGDRIYLVGGATAQGFGAADDNSVFFFE
jgi:N-acetylneuraminic acid mutarotase